MSSTRGLKINLTQRCEDCEEHQQFLLDSGDGSQVVCEHPISEESTTAAAATATTPSTSSDHSDTMVIDVDDDVPSVGESVNATDLEEVPLSTRAVDIPSKVGNASFLLSVSLLKREETN